MFLLCDGSPHLDPLGSNFFIGSTSSFGCDGTELRIEELYGVILLSSNFDQSLHGGGADILVLVLEGLE
jgi:hypothetical protein